MLFSAELTSDVTAALAFDDESLALECCSVDGRGAGGDTYGVACTVADMVLASSAGEVITLLPKLALFKVRSSTFDRLDAFVVQPDDSKNPAEIVSKIVFLNMQRYSPTNLSQMDLTFLRML